MCGLSDRWADPGVALAEWRRAAQRIIDARRRFGTRHLIVAHEDLAGDRETVMRAVASHLRIRIMPTMLVPTFNQWPAAKERSPSGCRRRVSRRVEELAGPIYRDVLKVLDS